LGLHQFGCVYFDNFAFRNGSANLLRILQYVKLWARPSAVLDDEVAAMPAGILDGFIPGLQTFNVLNLKRPFKVIALKKFNGAV